MIALSVISLLLPRILNAVCAFDFLPSFPIPYSSNKSVPLPNMRYIVAISLLLQASMGLEQGNNMPDIVAPGRADRMFVKRAGTDFGKQTVNCKGGEGACNNACYYINCVVSVCQLTLFELELICVCGRPQPPVSRIQAESCTSGPPRATSWRKHTTDRHLGALLEAKALVASSPSARSSATRQQVRVNTIVMNGHLQCLSSYHSAIRTDWRQTVYAAW